MNQAISDGTKLSGVKKLESLENELEGLKKSLSQEQK